MVTQHIFIFNLFSTFIIKSMMKNQNKIIKKSLRILSIYPSTSNPTTTCSLTSLTVVVVTGLGVVGGISSTDTLESSGTETRRRVRLLEEKDGKYIKVAESSIYNITKTCP